MNAPKTALLGTGIMGAAMARRLLGAKIPLAVWNRTREKAAPLAAEGARLGDTPRQAVEGADVVITILADANAIEPAAIGDGGFLSGMQRGAIWLQMSTVGVAPTERLAALANERGIAFVDAPVLGTKAPAEKGELVVLASGPESARGTIAPVLEAVSKKTLWLGEAGAGSRLKLVINDWLLGLVGALAETLAFARAIDVDPLRFLEAIDGGPIGPAYAQIKGRAMLAGQHDTSFPLSLALKDARLVIRAAEDRGFDPRITRAIAERFERAESLGHGREDMSAVFEAMNPKK